MKVDKIVTLFAIITLVIVVAMVLFPFTTAVACDDQQQPKVGDYRNGSTWDTNPKQINGGQGGGE